MDKSKNRLASFAHVTNKDITCMAHRLVENGFYYAGRNDEDYVKCFSCGLTYIFCPEDDVKAIHKRRSPDCVYLSLVNEIKSNPTIYTPKTDTRATVDMVKTAWDEFMRNDNLTLMRTIDAVFASYTQMHERSVAFKDFLSSLNVTSELLEIVTFNPSELMTSIGTIDSMRQRLVCEAYVNYLGVMKRLERTDD